MCVCSVQCAVCVRGVSRSLTRRLLTDYWDSYWIVQGLLQSELYDVANATLQNFMDEIARFGFIPNGGRIYCACILIAPCFVC